MVSVSAPLIFCLSCPSWLDKADGHHDNQLDLCTLCLGVPVTKKHPRHKAFLKRPLFGNVDPWNSCNSFLHLYSVIMKQQCSRCKKLSFSFWFAKAQINKGKSLLWLLLLLFCDQTRIFLDPCLLYFRVQPQTNSMGLTAQIKGLILCSSGFFFFPSYFPSFPYPPPPQKNLRAVDSLFLARFHL